MMKKIVFPILVAVLFQCTPMLAQVASVEFFPQGKALAKTYEPLFVGCKDGQAVFVQMTGRLRNKMELVIYDMEQEELARVALADEKEVDCYGGYINGDSVDLLMAEWKDNGMRVYRHRCDAKTMQPSGRVLTLADYKGTQGDKMGFTLGVSPNQQLLAGIYLIGRENQRGEMQVGFYSRELEEYWKMDSRCRGFNMMYVTDSGEVLLGSQNNGEYNIFILDGEREEAYSFSVEDKVSEVRIARYMDGKVYLVFTHSAKEDFFPTGTLVDYVGAICYDTQTQTVKVERHNIDKVEYNRLNNEKDGARVRDDDFRVLYMSLNQTLEDESGCYAMLDQSWRVTLEGVSTEYHRMGMMVCRIGNDGRFEWVKTCRVSNVTPWEARKTADYRWVSSAKGPLLVWVESKSSYDNPEEKPVKEFKTMNSAGILTALLMGSDGSMIRQHYEISSKQSLLGAPHLMDNGDYLLLMRGVSRGYFVKMKLEK